MEGFLEMAPGYQQFRFPVVIITSCVVAFISAALIPGFTLAAGFLLGGIVSPPDAVSASAILNH